MRRATIWTWDELYSHLSRDRAEQASLTLPIEVMEPLPGGVFCEPGADTGRFVLPVSDGSELHVELGEANFTVWLRAAPLPEVSWVPEGLAVPLQVSGGVVAAVLMLATLGVF